MTQEMHRLFSLLFPEAFRPSSYPPFNITAAGGEDGNHVTYEIEVAVAGFEKDQLAVDLDNRMLRISGTPAERPPVHYLHRGLARRAFQMEFLVNHRVVLEDASLNNGMLTIRLKREVARPVSIPISVTEPVALPDAQAKQAAVEEARV